METGEVRLGLLFDGKDDGLAPPTCNLEIAESGRIALNILTVNPRKLHAEQSVHDSFKRTFQWAAGDFEDVPQTLILESSEGPVTLIGLRWNGTSQSNGVTVVRLNADAAIFERPRSVSGGYQIQEFCSTIDGLSQFCGFSGFKYIESGSSASKSNTPIETLQKEAISWCSNGFEFVLEEEIASIGQEGSHFHLEVHPRLRTVSSNKAYIDEHYHAHREIRALLTLLFGCRLPWRNHELIDTQFPVRFVNGEEAPPLPVKVLLSRTVSQHAEAKTPPPQLRFPAATLMQLGARGLTKWCDRYKDEDFRHAVEPAVEAIATKGAFLEPTVMMLAISLDRFGYCGMGKKAREALYVHIKYCLDVAGIDWPSIGSNLGLAKFIAGVNNALKHPDYVSRSGSNGYPSFLMLVAARDLAIVAIRAQVLVETGLADDVLSEYLDSPSVTQVRKFFENNSMAVDGNGVITSSSHCSNHE